MKLLTFPQQKPSLRKGAEILGVHNPNAEVVDVQDQVVVVNGIPVRIRNETIRVYTHAEVPR
jgi:hypothetical protein